MITRTKRYLGEHLACRTGVIFLGFQTNGSKCELGAKWKSFLLSLAWKNLKQKLIPFQVKVDRYKSELPDLQKL